MSALTRRIDGAGRLRLAVVLGVYFAVLAVLRLGLFPGGSDDDAEILYYTQSWAMAYKGNQPPLYAWLMMAVQSVSGPTMGAVIAVKYALLAAFYAFSYLAARRLFSDNLFAAFAPLSLVACFFIGWDAVVNYSHTVLLLTAMSATLWLLLRLEKTSGWRDYLWLALAIAAGLLAKYNFALFLIPLLIGAWRHPGLRPRVFCPRFGGALVLALAMAGLPVALFLTDREAVAGVIGAGRLFPVIEDRLMAAAKGLGQFVIATLGLVSPFLPLGILFFPRALTSLPHPSERLINTGRFLEAYLLSLLILSVAAILATGATDVRNNWLVVWFPLPFYVLLRIKVFADAAGKPMARRLHWFAVALLVIAVAVPAGLAGRGIAGPQTCRKCNFFIPYEDLAQSLMRSGFSDGTIIAQDWPNQLAGNLRRYFPHARVVSTRWRDYEPPLGENAGGQGKCLLVWAGGGNQGGDVKSLAAQLRGAPLSNAPRLNRVTLSIPRNADHHKTWSYIVWEGAGRCR
ncbi:MAG: glycosyltransferase family 39 protein [Rhodospirillales bacterium]